jgi:hypothetical protein
METETFIADDTDNKELENLKNKWENLRIEVDKLKRRVWVYYFILVLIFVASVYIIIKSIFVLVSNTNYTFVDITFYILSSLIQLLSAFKAKIFGNLLKKNLQTYQELHQLTQKVYSVISNVVKNEDIIYVGRNLAYIEKLNHPYFVSIESISVALNLTSFFVAAFALVNISNMQKQQQDQTKFTTIESKIIILDNKLTKLQVQNDSLKIEIELLKKQVKK